MIGIVPRNDSALLTYSPAGYLISVENPGSTAMYSTPMLEIGGTDGVVLNAIRMKI